MATRLLFLAVPMLAILGSSPVAEGGRKLLSGFETSAEGWYVYEYNGAVTLGGVDKLFNSASCGMGYR